MRLAADRIAAAPRVIAPQLQHTPVVQLPWGACTLLLKDETAGPLACFKGRGADLFVAQHTGGPLVCASAGNFGLALADAGRRRGVAVTVYVATTANPHKVARIREHGATVIVHGDDFDAAKQAARTQPGFVEDGEAVAISEGAGTIAAELPPVDAIIVPVGNGALIAGIGTWMRAHHPHTRVIGVCATGAPVMAQAWRGHTLTPRAETIADGIAVRVPIPAAVADLASVVDDMRLVDDAALVTAMRTLYVRTGLAVEPSAVAGLAVLDQFPDQTVATVLTGANLSREQHARWLAEDPT